MASFTWGQGVNAQAWAPLKKSSPQCLLEARIRQSMNLTSILYFLWNLCACMLPFFSSVSRSLISPDAKHPPMLPSAALPPYVQYTPPGSHRLRLTRDPYIKGITRVSISRLRICGSKKILQSLKPKGWLKMAISSLRQISRRTFCAEESNLRKKGLACNIPNGMLFKCSLYVTARWDTMEGIQVTLGQVAFQMPPALRFLKTVLSERQLDLRLGIGHWERLSYGVCRAPSWALAVLTER